MKRGNKKIFKRIILLAFIILNFIIPSNQALAVKHLDHAKDENNLYLIHGRSDMLKVVTGSPDRDHPQGSKYLPKGEGAADWSFCLQKGKAFPNYNPANPPHYSNPNINQNDVLKFFENPRTQYIGLFQSKEDVGPDDLYDAILDSNKRGHRPYTEDRQKLFYTVRNLLYLFAQDPENLGVGVIPRRGYYSVIEDEIWHFVNSQQRANFQNPITKGQAQRVRDIINQHEGKDDLIPKYIKTRVDIYDSVWLGGKKGVQNTATLRMDYLRERVEFEKVNENNVKLGGAEIEITKEESEKVYIYDNYVKDPEENYKKDFTTIEDTNHFINMREGVYKFHEKKAPKGYKTVPDFKFRVTVGGKVELVDPSAEVKKLVKVDGFKISIKDESAIVETDVKKVSFTKYGKNSLAKGAELEIYDSANKKVAQWTTDGSKNWDLTLPAGKKYRFHEKKAPVGYKTIKDFYFTVHKEVGRPTELHNIVDTSKVYLAGSHVIVVDDEKPKKEIQIEKLSEDRKALAGAEFELYIKGEPYPVDKWTSGANVHKTQVYPGVVYTMKETKVPDGKKYKKIGDFDFTVEENGNIKLSGSPANVKAVNNKLSITNTYPDKFRIGFGKKKSILDPGFLTGARFEVHDEKGNIVEKWWTISGVTHFEIKPGKYTLKEVVNPQGYEEILDIKFEVGKDGSFKIEDYDKVKTNGISSGVLLSPSVPSSDNKWEGEIPVVTIIDKKLKEKKVTISKRNEKDVNISGARLEIWEFKRTTTTTTHIADLDTTNSDQEVALNCERTYLITETNAPDGYKEIEDFKLQIDESGNLKLIDNKNGDLVRLEGNKLVIRDPKNEKDISLSKINFFDKRVANARFDIFESTNLNKSIGTLTSKADGADPKIKLTCGKEYVIKESQAPEGYNKVNDFKIIVGDDGVIAFVGSHEGVDISGDTLKIKDPFKEFPVEIKKVDEEGKALGGVGFTIYSRRSDGVYRPDDNWNSSNGYKKGLWPNDYKVEETSTPQGYVPIDPFEFEVQPNGQVAIKGANPNVSVDNKTVTITITNKFVKYPIKISKIDQKGNLLNGSNNNARLQIFSVENGVEKAIKGWVWNTTSQQTLEFKAGTYKLKEISTPNGYQEIGDILFEVKHGGAVEIKSNTSNATVSEIENNTKEIKVINRQKKDVVISKQDPEGNALAGAKFEIYDKTDLTNKVASFTSEKTDKTVSLASDKNYVIKELEAPEGFEKITDLEINIDKDCNISLVSNPNGESVKLQSGKLIIKDKRKEKEVHLSKVNEFTKRVAGGVFQIFESTNLNKAIAELTSTGSGQDVKTKLEFGKEYLVKEKTAPEGYKLVKDFKLSLSKAGALSLSENDKNVWLEGDKLVIKEPFKAYPVKIKKVDEDGNPLGGVKFIISSKRANGDYGIDNNWTSDSEYSKGLWPNDYRVEEVETPQGYLPIEPFEFEVQPNGQVAIKGTNSNVSVDNKTVTITITNKFVKYPIKISKIDQKGDLVNNKLNPARLELYRVEDKKETKIDAWYSNIQPDFNLRAGDYKIKETQTPNGYEGTGEITFEIKHGGAVEIKSNSSNVTLTDFKNDGKEIKVINRQKKDVVISKQDPEGNALAGAKFDIYEKTDQTKPVASFTSEKTDKTVSLASDKNYVIRELEAPEGFEKITDLEINIDSDCNISLVSNPNGDSVKLQSGKLIIKDKQKKYPIKISKIDQKGDLVNNKLNPARLELYRVEDKKEAKIDAWYTNVQPDFNLRAGDYKIKETQTPNGYEGTGEILFEVKHGGAVEIKSNTSNATVSEIENNTKEIKVINRQKKDVIISKQDPEGNNLKGARLEIYDSANKDTVLKSIDTNESDSNASLLYGKRYLVKEINVPEGYEKISDFEFEISNDGNIKLVGSPNGVSISGNKLVIVDKRKKYEVNFKKVDENNNQLNTARLEIYTKNNTYVEGWKTDIIAKIPLEPGVYKLKETTTPKGYEGISEVTFTVNANGSVSITNNENVSLEGNLITVKNKKKDIPPPPVEKPKKTLKVTVHKLLLDKDEFASWVSPKGYDASQDKDKFDILTQNKSKQQIPNVYFVWKNDKDQFINNQGNVVNSIDEAFGKLTTATGAEFDTTNLPDGEYKIYEVKEKSDYSGVNGEVLTKMKATPIKIKLPFINENGLVENVHVYPKNTVDKPKIDKNFDSSVKDEGVDTELNLDNSQREKSKISRTIGDVIPYAVKTLIPMGSEYKKLTWTDNMTDGLTFDKNISLSGADLDTNDYSVEEDDRGYSLSLNESGLKKVEDACKKADLEIMIKYSASLNAKAVVDLEKLQENTIAIDYSNKPSKASSPLEITPVKGEIKVDKSWISDGQKQVSSEDNNLALTYILEEKSGTSYSQLAAVTLRYSGQNPSFDYKFTGLDNKKTYRIRERVGGYEPNYVSSNNGVLKITNVPNKTYIRPSNPKVETCGKKFVKVNTEDERLLGAIFAIKKDGKYLKAKSLGGRTQDKELLKQAKEKLLSALDTYNNLKAEDLDKDVGSKAKQAIADNQNEYNKAFLNEAIGFDYTDNVNDADVIKLTSNDNGQFMIRGLGAGSYELEELKAPKGYAKVKNLNFEIESTSFSNGNIKYSEIDKTNTATKVINRKVIIPQTGGIGSLLFMMFGLALMIFSLIRFRKLSINQDLKN